MICISPCLSSDTASPALNAAHCVKRYCHTSRIHIVRYLHLDGFPPFSDFSSLIGNFTVALRYHAGLNLPFRRSISMCASLSSFLPPYLTYTIVSSGSDEIPSSPSQCPTSNPTGSFPHHACRPVLPPLLGLESVLEEAQFVAVTALPSV